MSRFPYRIPASVHQTVLAALAVLLPTECVGCGMHDHPVCTACAGTLGPPVPTAQGSDDGAPHSVALVVVAGRAPPLQVWATEPYGGILKSALSAFKESGRTDVAPWLAGLLQVAIRDACSTLGEELPAGATLELTSAPSSRAAFRQRGYNPVQLLARRARCGHPLTRTLRVARATADQAGLGIDARRANLGGSLRVRSRFARAPTGGGLAGRHFVLVDDVITTGSTLLECRRALEAAGATVWGAATLAFAEKHVGVSAVRRTRERAEHIQ